MENGMWLKRPTSGPGLASCLIMILTISFAPFFVGETLAAKKAEVLNTAPDSNTAGLLNTEVVPEGAFQFDFATGHLWYGSSPRINIFTNIYLAGLTLSGTPVVSLGGKTRYCQFRALSCSLLAEVAVGARLLGEKQKKFGALFQNSIAYDVASAGRMTFGVGLALLANRSFDLTTSGFEDQFFSWMNFFYDVALETDWSVGVGYSPTFRTFHQYPIADNLFVNRTGFAGTSLAHVRTQYSMGNWQIAGGGALLSEAGSWSLWPVLEVIWRKPESLFVDEEPTKKGTQLSAPAKAKVAPDKSPSPSPSPSPSQLSAPAEQAIPTMEDSSGREVKPVTDDEPGTELKPSPGEYEQ
ncbi:hypothetical protein EBR21_02050 [bacterium]|nr:hypothetical protein [bacterium]